jgi:hypothetical protein
VDVKYLSCAFERVYVLDVINMPKKLLYKGIPMELHVYNTHDYFNTIQPYIRIIFMMEVHNFVKNAKIHIFVNKKIVVFPHKLI